MNWYDGMTADDLPGDLRLVARECGVNIAIALAEKLGGINIYIRPLKSLESVRKKEFIAKHFDGTNHKELAIATGYCEQQIYRILEEATQPKKDDRQDPLFEM